MASEKKWVAKGGWFAAFFLLFLAPSGLEAKESIVRAQYVMGTILEITLFAEDEKEGERAVEAAFLEARRLDRLMSSYREDSEISLINQSPAGSKVKVSRELFSLLKRAQGFSELSGGAFDITVGPLLRLWGFYGEEGGVPTRALMEETMARVGREKIVLHEKENKVELKAAGMEIDLGAIGKGYALAQVGKILGEQGVDRGKVDFGGNLLMLKAEKEGDRWAVTIRNPRKGRKPFTGLTLSRGAVSTSGGYERFITIKGKQYSHIINPLTGFPVEHILSATVISADPVAADALSTALAVLPPEKGLALIEKLEGVEALIHKRGDDRDGGKGLLLSKGLEKMERRWKGEKRGED